MKVEEQVKFLNSHRTGIGVGTPGRLSDLIDDGKRRRYVVVSTVANKMSRGTFCEEFSEDRG
jgi:hypothetical protein